MWEEPEPPAEADGLEVDDFDPEAEHSFELESDIEDSNEDSDFDFYE